MGYRLRQLPVGGQRPAVAPSLGLLVEDADHLLARLPHQDVRRTLGEPRVSAPEHLLEAIRGGLVDLAGRSFEEAPGHVDGEAAVGDRDVSGLRHFLNRTRRPHSSRLLTPNSVSLEIFSLSKTGPSLHTRESSITQHPQTPAPHFM